MTDSEKNLLLLQWLRLRFQNEPLSARIYAKKYKTVAVCGFREYGRLLVEELQAEGVRIAYIIEKNYQSLQVIDESLGIPIVGFQEEINGMDADAIIVTPDLDMAQVRENLEMAEGKIPMIGLQQLLL